MGSGEIEQTVERKIGKIILTLSMPKYWINYCKLNAYSVILIDQKH